MKWKVLYFDDRQDNIESIEALLSDKFQVIGCTDVGIYEEMLGTHHLHAILLDIYMPVMGGYELYTKIVEHPYYNGCPIMFISGDHSDENKLQSHNCGAIDFFCRDMHPEELKVRMISRVRLFLQSSLKLSIGNLKIDFEVLNASLGNSIIDLTLVEMRILGALFRNYPGHMNRSELIKKVWGEEFTRPGSVDVHFSTIRAKLKDWDHYIKSKNDTIIIEPVS